jgi:hypothetical protein
MTHDESIVGRFCETPRRLTQAPYTESIHEESRQQN